VRQVDKERSGPEPTMCHTHATLRSQEHVQEKTFALSSTSRNDAESISVAVAILRQVGWSLNADADHELQEKHNATYPTDCLDVLR
jgi:hypothetical protein